MKLSRLLFFPALLLLCGSVRAQSPVTPGQVEIHALHGLEAIVVEVKSDVQAKGFESDLIRSSVEKRLKAENIPVVNVSPDAARLLFTLKQAGDAVLIRVRLLRLVSQTCKDDRFYAPMWEREMFSYFSKGHVPFDVSYMTDTFAADYNSINRR